MSVPFRQRFGAQLRDLHRHRFFERAQWQRRAALWSGGVLVGLAAVAFARASDLAFGVFQRVLTLSRFWPLLLTPLVFALLSWLTQGALKQTRGSGIPQVIAAMHVDDAAFRKRLLALPVALGKMVLTLIALIGGASIGREGPTVHVGAGLMLWLGRRFGFSDPIALSRFILAGGGAGIAAAFNTPLAGVVFAIEELAGAFEHRFSGIILTAVIFAGIVSLGLLGNYAYFGRVSAELPLGEGWLAILACGICGGLGGGLFSRLILLEESGPLAHIATLRKRWPIVFAGACGLALALLGLASAGTVYGTGYVQAHNLVQSTHGATDAFGLLKFGANTLSYWAGIPGGIFSPALAVGAGMGNTLAGFLHGTDPTAVVLLGMAAFLAGVTQAPLTAAVISLELTANQNLIIPIMATCLISRAISTLPCPTPIYRALANRLVKEYEVRDIVVEPVAVLPPPADDVPPAPDSSTEPPK